MLFRSDLPEERLSHLKTVGLNRKKKALTHIVEKSGSKDDLLYIGGLEQKYVEKIMEL